MVLKEPILRAAFLSHAARGDIDQRNKYSYCEGRRTEARQQPGERQHLYRHNRGNASRSEAEEIPRSKANFYRAIGSTDLLPYKHTVF